MGWAFNSGFEAGIAPSLGAVMPEECAANKLLPWRVRHTQHTRHAGVADRESG